MQQPVNLTFDLDQLARGWAKFADLHLAEYLREHQSAAATNALLKSIISRVASTGNTIDQVLTQFLQYGRFYDMGVGRGVPIGAAGTGAFSAARNANGSLKRYRRKAVKWFSRTYYREVQRFKELYVEHFNQDIPVKIADAMNANINLNV